MPFNFKHLTPRVRELMLEEMHRDQQNGELFVGKHTNEDGRAAFPALLAEAIQVGDETSLAQTLHRGFFLAAYEKKIKGGMCRVPVPPDANRRLAEGEFNRFYIRAVCRLAIEQGITEVEIYRARHSENPRSESQARIGQLISAKALLSDLRDSQGVDTALGCPPGPGSGLSVKLSSDTVLCSTKQVVA